MGSPEGFLSRQFSRAVAERQLVLVTAGGQRPLIARLGEPVQDVPSASGDDWRCPIQIEGWEHTPPPGVGVDSFQALLGAIKLLSAYLTQIERQTGGVLHWLGEPGHFVPEVSP